MTATDRRALSNRDEVSPGAIRRAISRYLVIGFIGFCVMILGLGGMATMIDFAGAIVAQGRLVVDTSVKKVQHPNGGTVAEIHVVDGDRVQAGDILVRLDSTVTTANLAVITQGIDEIVVQRARLEAERDGAATIDFPPDILARRGEPEITKLIEIEAGQFESRRAARDGQKDQLRKKISELQEQLAGVAAQQDAVKREIAFTHSDLQSLTTLQLQGLVESSQVSAVERLAAQYDGELGQLIGSAGQVGAAIAETNLQILQIDTDLKSAVEHDLSDDESKLNELTEHAIAARDELRNREIRAPQSGTVYQLSVHTVGGVVGPGETIMMIVPTNDLLVVEARIDPGEVDRVHAGSEAGLRFASLGARTTPQFTGVVETVSPDVAVDERTGTSYFTARIKLPADALATLGKSLFPGMPVEVFVTTGERTALSYLVKPLTDQIAHMFRER